jgi:hypothetical protein
MVDSTRCLFKILQVEERREKREERREKREERSPSIDAPLPFFP